MLDPSAMITSIIDNVLDLLKSFTRDHGATVHTRTDAFCGQGGTKTEGTNALDNKRIYIFILRRVNDETFNPDTVLPGILAARNMISRQLNGEKGRNLLNAAHPDACPLVDVSTRKNDRWVLSTKLHGHRGQMFRRCCGNLYTS